MRKFCWVCGRVTSWGVFMVKGTWEHLYCLTCKIAQTRVKTK